MRLYSRFFKYNAVSALGFAFKLGALVLFCDGFGMGYLASTALAVETAMAHNFVWHLHWTWRDRPVARTGRDIAARLLRFQCANGAVSLLTNVAIVRVLVETAGLHYFVANLAATAASGLLNFALANLWVFARPGGARP